VCVCVCVRVCELACAHACECWDFCLGFNINLGLSSARVASRINDVPEKDRNRLFGLDESVLVEVNIGEDNSGVVVVSAILTSHPKDVGKERAESVLRQIRFWVQQEGLDKQVKVSKEHYLCCMRKSRPETSETLRNFYCWQCSSCLDDIYLDQGVSCPSGHYFCASPHGNQSCMANLIESQIPCVKAQKEALLCPICKREFVNQRVASMVSDASWGKLQKAIVDSKLASQCAEMQRDFDSRLQRKVDELYEKFASDGSAALKEQGRKGAEKARSEALNLACPHCDTVYYDFEGCMALTCSSCQKHFCGYCHKQTQNSRSCHDHVRECDMNQTINGSYYADANQVKEAQRRYRVKRLKRFLRDGYKKDVQNAIILALSDDLLDLGIDPKALFEVGNMQFP